MEKKILYNVLKGIWRVGNTDAAPDNDYLKSIENVGIIKIDWEVTLTDFGHYLYETLKNEIEWKK